MLLGSSCLPLHSLLHFSYPHTSIKVIEDITLQMESDSPLPDFPLPPLPLITDIGLKRLAMTHRSAANLPHIDGPVEAQEPKDYRKLAHFGDSLVGEQFHR